MITPPPPNARKLVAELRLPLDVLELAAKMKDLAKIHGNKKKAHLEQKGLILKIFIDP